MPNDKVWVWKLAQVYLSANPGANYLFQLSNNDFFLDMARCQLVWLAGRKKSEKDTIKSRTSVKDEVFLHRSSFRARQRWHVMFSQIAKGFDSDPKFTKFMI